MAETTWDTPRGYPFRDGGDETATVQPRTRTVRQARARGRDNSVMNPDQDDTTKWPSGNSATRRRERCRYLSKKTQPKGKGARFIPMSEVNGDSANPNSPESYLEQQGI
jgi:hypothetical protein